MVACAPVLRKNIDYWITQAQEVHMSLQHTYISQSFQEFFGNEEQVTLVLKLLEEDPPKAFLLVGPSGCGKTTLAYLIKDAYGGEDCDFIEIDGSKDRGIKYMREMAEELDYVPLGGAQGKKVILLDEIHGITHDAQEAILKTLQKPPENCMLILATTEPEKLKVTTKRRCKVINLMPLSMRDMIDHLNWVLESEGFNPDDWADSIKKKIYSVSEGSPGIALELLDSVIHAEAMEEEGYLKFIETLSYNVTSVNEIARNLIDWPKAPDDKWKVIRAALEGINTDFDGIRRGVLGYLGKVMLNPKQHKNLEKLMQMADFFVDNFYDSGKTGLIMACYFAVYQC